MREAVRLFAFSRSVITRLLLITEMVYQLQRFVPRGVSHGDRVTRCWGKDAARPEPISRPNEHEQ
jgi:hypothetical protein